MMARWVWLIGLVLLAGCGRSSDIQRVIVSGKVSYQGQPIADGAILFTPVKGTKGPAAAARIENGAYQAAIAGGVPVGTHRVEVLAFRASSGSSQSSGSQVFQMAKEQFLPKQYNRESTLTATVDDNGKQTKDFELH
jgi:hypothetical protein